MVAAVHIIIIFSTGLFALKITETIITVLIAIRKVITSTMVLNEYRVITGFNKKTCL